MLRCRRPACHAVAQERGYGNLTHRAQFQHPMMDGEAPWISIALRHKTELNLSTDQVANLEKIRTAFQNQVTPIAQQLKAIEGDLRATCKSRRLIWFWPAPRSIRRRNCAPTCAICESKRWRTARRF